MANSYIFFISKCIHGKSYFCSLRDLWPYGKKIPDSCQVADIRGFSAEVSAVTPLFSSPPARTTLFYRFKYTKPKIAPHYLHYKLQSTHPFDTQHKTKARKGILPTHTHTHTKRLTPSQTYVFLTDRSRDERQKMGQTIKNKNDCSGNKERPPCAIV